MKIRPLQLNCRKCAFGHYYYAVPVKNPIIANEWSKIDKLHANFHEKGKSVISAIGNGNEKNAKEYMDEIKADSDQLMKILNYTSEAVDKLTSEGKSIFDI